MSDTTDAKPAAEDLRKPTAGGAPTLDDFAEDFGDFDEFDPPPAPKARRGAPARPAPVEADEAPAGQGRDRDESRAQGLPEGFEATVRVKGPRGRPVEKTAAERGPDPLAWLADTRVGMIRITRKAGNGVTGEGRATRGKFKGKYVGLGECGVLDITNAEDVLDQIRHRWGGGNYQVTHLDGQNQPGRSVQLSVPQDPLPAESVTPTDPDEEEDEDDDDSPSRLMDIADRLGGHGRTYDDPYGDRYADPREQGGGRIWRPAYLDEQEKTETTTVQRLLEEERDARRKLEAKYEREQLQREHDRERAALSAEMSAIKQLVTQKPTGKDPMEMFMAMMAEQNRQSQERYEREARERKDRDEREARERREAAERDRAHREEERRRQDADRARQDALAAAAQAQNQQFMQMVLGQKQDPMAILNTVLPLLPKQDAGGALASLTQAFEIVERARDIASPASEGEDEGGLAGAIRAATPALQPIAEGVMRALSREDAPEPRRQVQVQQQRPAQQAAPAPVAALPAPAALPAQPPAKKQDTLVAVGQVAKIVGVVASAWQQKQAPTQVAAALVGYAAGIGAEDMVEQIAESNLAQIKQQLTLAKNLGLPVESVAQIDAFLTVYDTQEGQVWLAQVLAALGDDGE